MSKHWNDELMELEKRDNLTLRQTVAMEGWDLRWEIKRLNLMPKAKEAEIVMLRYDRAMLKAELNSVRGRKK